MKNLTIVLLSITSFVITSCSNNAKDRKINGKWVLSSFKSDSEVVNLSDCDKQTIWNFTTTVEEPLGDGTEVQKLEATAPEDCQFYGFDSKWTVKDEKLFISSSRIGGMGGNSLAGLMTIKELTENKMILEIFRKELIFERTKN